jgi:hypothetical protein
MNSKHREYCETANAVKLGDFLHHGILLAALEKN